jgi:hypothetical protein
MVACLRPPLERARWLLVGLAVVVRVAFRLESTQLPFMDAPLFDSAVYLHQADAIRAGHFGDASLLAFGPLYGWFLAIFGAYAIDVQLVLGLVTTLLVAKMCEHRSPEAGLIGLALWIGYAIPLFYETLVVSETLGLCLTAGAFATYTARSFDEPRTALLGGVLAGLATLTRANLLFALPFFVAFALVPRDREPVRARSRRAAAMTLGIALVLGANGLWNLAHVGRFVPVILASRTASRASAHGAWTGSLAPLGSGQAPPSAWDVVEQARVTLASSDPAPTPSIDVGGWIASSPDKLARTLSDVETTFDYGFYGERTELRSLAWEPISMGTLLALGLLGAVALVRRKGWRALVPYLPLVLGTLIVTTLFHPSGRYRVAMSIPLVVLAAEGIAHLLEAEGRRLRTIGLAAVLTLVVALGVRHLTHPLASPGMWQLRVAEGEAARGWVDAARERTARALAIGGPDVVERVATLRAARALP